MRIKCKCKNSKEVSNCDDKYRCDKNPIKKSDRKTPAMGDDGKKIKGMKQYIKSK